MPAVVRLDTTLEYPDVGVRDVDVTYIPQSSDGIVNGVVVLAEDVSARKRHEGALRAQERRWHAMFDAQPECVTVVAPDGHIIDINPAGLALLEADSIESVRGRTLEELIDPEHLPLLRAQHQAALADRPLEQPGELAIVGVGCTRRTLESRAVPLHDEAGRVTAVLSVTRDISERRRGEQALQQADQRKDEFLATLAHELLQPRR